MITKWLSEKRRNEHNKINVKIIVNKTEKTNKQTNKKPKPTQPTKKSTTRYLTELSDFYVFEESGEGI